jgi:hypothetical protein
MISVVISLNVLQKVLLYALIGIYYISFVKSIPSHKTLHFIQINAKHFKEARLINTLKIKQPINVFFEGYIFTANINYVL